MVGAVVTIAAAAPSPTGGAIADGTYHLVSAVGYTGPGGASGPVGFSTKETLTLTGGRLDVITDEAGKSKTASGTFALSGTDFTFMQSCPGAPPTITPYSASAASFVLYVTDGGATTFAMTYGP
jgi:hypothetical protein